MCIAPLDISVRKLHRCIDSRSLPAITGARGIIVIETLRQLRDDIGIGRIFYQVHRLAGVGDVVIKFAVLWRDPDDFVEVERAVARSCAPPLGVTISIGAQTVAHSGAAICYSVTADRALILTERCLLPRLIRIFEQRHHGRSLQLESPRLSRKVEATNLGEGREHVDQFDRGSACPSSAPKGVHSRRADNQRHTRSRFVVAVLRPETVVIPEVPTVVSPEHDDGIVRNRISRARIPIRVLERIQEFANLRIGKADTGHVGMDQMACLCSRRNATNVAVAARFTAERGSESIGSNRKFFHPGVAVQINLRRVVEIPVALRTREWQVRFLQTNCNKKAIPSGGQLADLRDSSLSIGTITVVVILDWISTTIDHAGVGSGGTSVASIFQRRLGRLVKYRPVVVDVATRPRGRILLGVPTAVVNLTGAKYHVAVRSKMLRDGDDIRVNVAEEGLEFPASCVVRPHACHDARARGIADRLLTVRIGKP